ncbi:helix-hairpin-helix domain-containing protein [Curtobacterium sp. MCBD17_030]|uniref:ComEA family DNA-binding protein n=1 Tax=Curtobacterium sp. MCBD17_030 TaxID=2175649 RepID=UPI000D8A3395|nr:helix-hairpin-helix domain-containing protein [Curtobacterium sp. MCBD17_030]PYY32775.1 hypothetical protein DEI89_11900 [Curtobacterium sp. MCBD17_030]
MNSNNADPQALLASRGWRLRHSLWLLAPILGFGIFSFVGFLYIAIRVRSRKFWIVAAAASAGGVLIWVLLGNPDSEKGSGSDNVLGAVLFGVWAASVALGCIINRDYLRWRATSRGWWTQQTLPSAKPEAASGGTPVYYTGAAQAGPLHQQPQSQPDVLGVNTAQYFAPSPQSAAPPAASAPWAPSAPAPSPTGTTSRGPAHRAAGPGSLDVNAASAVDVNAASAAELALQFRITSATASRIVAARQAQGPYRDLQDVVLRARLEPHEMTRLRTGVLFGHGPSTSQPAPPAPQANGRVLDI